MELKSLESIVRAVFVEEFGENVRYCTDPVADYGVKYEQKTEIKYKGEKLEAWYGTTKKKMPYWKMQLNKKHHGGVIHMGEMEFLEGNVLAFYWIHKKEFEHRKLSKGEIDTLMIRLCEGLYQDHLRYDIYLEPIYETGKGKWDLFIKGVWESIKGEKRPEIFCTMTNIFPMDGVGRREIGRVEVNKAVDVLIDTVRQTMDEVDSFQNGKVLEEIHYYTAPNIKFKGTTRTQNERINKYYRDFLGFTDEQKLEVWISTIRSHKTISSIDELAGYMGITPSKVHKLLKGSSWKPSKTQQLDKLLTEAMISAKTKSEVMVLSGKPRTTIYRRLKKNKALKFLWDQI